MRWILATYHKKGIIPDTHTYILNDIALDKSYDTAWSYRCSACFSKDWLTLYWGKDGTVRWRTLTTAWDVSTATWWWSITFSGMAQQNMQFTSDMKTLFFFDYSANGYVIKMSLTTAWDLSTATTAQSVAFKNWSYRPTWWVISDDWHYMYLWYENNSLKLWNLTTAFDLSTAVSAWSTTAPVWVTRWLALSSNCKHLYWWADSKVWQIDMATANDLSSITTQNKTMSNSPAQFYYCNWLFKNNDILLTIDGRYIRTWTVA